MIEERTDQNGQTYKISEMSTEHIINAIKYIKRRYNDWVIECDAYEDESDELDIIEKKYQALHNELVLRLAEKYLKDEEENIDLPF